MRRTFYGLLLALLLFSTAAPVVAHHALQAEYDTSKRGEFTGVLTRFLVINPHVRWLFDVKNPDGTLSKWEIAGAGPGGYRTLGLTRVFKVGDTYKVTYAPARRAANLGRIVTITLPDGRIVSLFHEDPNNPNDL